jgi:transposase
MHRLLRCGAGPPPTSRWCHGDRDQPADKATRRRVGKTDTLDAEAAARAVLSGRATGSAKAGDGPVEMLRMFKLAKASAIKARTQAINQLKAVRIATDPALREALSGLSNTALIRRCTQLEGDTPQDPTSAAAYTLRLLAGRILALTDEIRDLEQQITTAVTNHTPQIADPPRHRPRQRRRPAHRRR